MTAKTAVYIVLVICSGLSATGITFTFNNGQYTENELYFEFDIMVSGSDNSTLLGDTQVYVNYNPDAFGENVVTEGNLTISKGLLVQGEFIAGIDLYQIGSVNDNTSERFAFNLDYAFDEPPLAYPDSANALTTSPSQLIHVKINVTDSGTSTGISFQQNLMQGQQYDSSTSVYDPVIASDILDTSLPVTLSDFYVEISGTIPQISWTTQSEINNLYWNIYRSVSLNIGQAVLINEVPVEGAGTTSQPTDYFYEDSGMDEYIYYYDLQDISVFYYWLESVSYSGETITFGPVPLLIETGQEIVPPHLGINRQPLGFNYPNPFNPVTNIELSIGEGDRGVLSIYDLKGRQVIKKIFEPGTHIFSWQAGNCPGGIYLYRLKTERGIIQTRKMLLLK